MIDRLNFFAVLRGHWKSLRVRSGNVDLGPDLFARGALLGSAAAVVILSLATGLELRQPGVLFAGLALLSSGLLAAFAQMASIRSRFPVPDDPDFDSELDTRNMLDEAVAHVLTAALLAAFTAALIVVAISVGPVEQASSSIANSEQSVNNWFSTAIAGLGTYLFVLFVMTIRKLYAAYVVGNEVSRELSGHHTG